MSWSALKLPASTFERIAVLFRHSWSPEDAPYGPRGVLSSATMRFTCVQFSEIPYVQGEWSAKINQKLELQTIPPSVEKGEQSCSATVDSWICLSMPVYSV